MVHVDWFVVAALFIDERGPYANMPGVDAWGVSRDARAYVGPWPVVAHPPCDRWGRYSTGSPKTSGRYITGDDGGCFKAALTAVRRWGGVLEHPAASKAWGAFGLLRPRFGEWSGGPVEWTTEVDQAAYGHTAAKPTWLLVVGPRPPPLPWTRAAHRVRLRRPDGRLRAAKGDIENLSKRQRCLTPIAFRDALIALALPHAPTSTPPALATQG